MTHNLAISLSGDHGILASFSIPSGNAAAEIDEETIPAEATTLYTPFAFPVNSSLKLVMIVADIDCFLIINSNDPGTGDEIPLYANTPFLWYDGIGATASEVVGASAWTQFYIHNYGEDAGVLRGIALYDPTP